MTNWREVKLGDICEITSSKRIFMADYVTSGIPFYRSKEIIEKQRGNNISTELFITEEKYEEIKQKFSVPQEGDILLTSVGTIGIPYIVKRNEKFYFKDGNLTWIKKSKQLLTEYLYYFLISTEGKFKLENISIGTTQKAITIVGLKGLEISLPPIDTQKKIAGILSALDDKIELNNKINNNLEQQAQALIQEHIINIKTIIPLDELCNVFTGRKNANEFDENGKNKFFTCGPEALTINGYIYDGPAIIVSGNGAYTGRTRFFNGKFDLYQRTYACTLKESIHENYIYLLYPLLKMVLEKKLMGGTHGSAIPYIVMNDITKFEVPFEKETFNKISPVCKTLVDKIQANERENERLYSLRDTLLPKLMSGEIDVSRVNISADKLSFTGDK